MNKEKFMNLGVGQTFELNDKVYKVKEQDNCDKYSCEGCAFYFVDDCLALDIPECCHDDRKDEKAVIFVELEED